MQPHKTAFLALEQIWIIKKNIKFREKETNKTNIH